MCGIAGIVDLRGQFSHEEMQHMVIKMRETMEHRGPDDSGIWISNDGRCALAHRRLSIIDLRPEGRQPILNEDKSCAVTFNGEIYNYQDFRDDLKRQGHRFRSRTDTEVLLHMLEDTNDKAEVLRRINGMFAFGFWDDRHKTLLLGRDLFGKKPLYYVEGNGFFAFASELSAFSQLSAFDRSFSRDSIALYLMLQYVPAPHTIFERAKKLPAGNMLQLGSDGTIRVSRFSQLPFFMQDPGTCSARQEYIGPESSKRSLGGVIRNKIIGLIGKKQTTLPDLSPRRVEELRGLLINAVERRLMSDVPLGAFLSGGVDSSLVVALMVRELGIRPTTFSIGFSATEETEHHHAQYVADKLGTNHNELILSPDVLSTVNMVATSLDEPLGDSSCLPTLLLSEFARKEVTVILSGDGGDEMFGGYGRYFDTLSEEKESLLSGSQAWSPDAAYMTYRIFQMLPPQIAEMMGGMPARIKSYTEGWREHLSRASVPLLHRLRALDAASYMPGAVLAKVDRMSMRHSLEVRSPLLDPLVADFAQYLTPQECYADGLGKLILKEVAARYFPMDWLNRKKMGFGLPMTFWQPEQLVTFAEDELLHNNAPLLDWLDRKKLAEYIELQKRPGCCSVYQIWNLLILSLWMRNYAKMQRSLD